MKDLSPPKKLTRSRSDRYVGGVAAGLAARLGIDPVFVRIAFVVSLALGGLGLLAYVAMLIAVPLEGDPTEPAPPLEPRRRNLMIGLAVLAGFAFVVTADSGSAVAWLFGFWPGTVFGILFWVAAAGLATWLALTGAFERDPDHDAGAGSPRAGRAGATPSTPSEATAEVVTYAESPTQLSRTEVMETRQMGNPPAGEGSGAQAAGPAVVRDDGPSTIGKIMTWFAIGLTGLIVFCLLFGFSAGVTATLGGVPMAALVIILGAGMVFAGLRGRRQLSAWLLAAAVAVTLPMAAVSIADLRVEGPYGDINETPLSVVDIPGDGYEMAAGNQTIDLRRLDYAREARRNGTSEIELPVEMGMGLTSIIVPDRVCVTGSVDGKAGIVNIRGRQSSGFSVSQSGLSVGPDRPRYTVNVDGDFKLGAFEIVDATQWRQDGSGGSFADNDFEPADRASREARKRAEAACAAPAPTRENAKDGVRS